MKAVLTLMKPRFWAFLNGGISRGAWDSRARLYFFSAIGLVFWLGIYMMFYRVLTYFKGVEGFGDILAAKLMSMVVVTFFTLLLFSSVIVTLSKLYISRDLPLVHSLPVAAEQIFLARWLESLIDSSWMVILFSLPILLSYGMVFKAGIFFYGMSFLSIFSLCLVASGLSTLAVLGAATVLPAGRIRTISVFFGVLLILVLVIAVRMMRPEQLVNPEAFNSVAVYLQSLETTGSPLLPTTWIYDGIQASLLGMKGKAFFNLALSVSGGMALLFLNMWISERWYFRGYSQAQTTPPSIFSPSPTGKGWDGLLSFLPAPVKALTVKEIKTFFRDQTQWPQLFLLMALIVVYLYNFSVLPLDRTPIKTVYLQNLFSFLNMGLATFVLTAIAARFVFPAVSLEGQSFWIVRSSPVSIRTFLWIKFFIYYLPLAILSEVLIVVSNFLLDVTPFMMALSVTTVLFMVPGIVALGIGFGAAYPDFSSENPTQTVTSFGGLLYMTICAGFITLVSVLEAGPVYAVFMAGLRGQGLDALQWVWLIGSFCLVLVLCALAVAIPMKMGEKRLRM
jgi:ABC-2 type transport system permease protein